MVYGRRGPADKIEHEVGITEFAVRYPDAEFSRDGRVGRAIPDLMMIWQGRTCFVEIDLSENMATATQMAEKWNRYGDVIEGFVSLRLEVAGEGRREIKVRMTGSDHGPGNGPLRHPVLSNGSIEPAGD